MNLMLGNPTYNWGRGVFARRNPVVATPTTSNASLTFYYDRSKKKFDKKFYSPALTGGRLSTEQLAFFLRDVEQLLKKRSRSVALMVGLFLFIIFGGFWMLCSTFDDDYDTTEDDVDDALFMMVLYFFTMIIFAIGVQKSQTNAIKETRDSIQDLIDRNHLIFAAQGLKWNIPQHFPLWLELWTDYREQQPVYALPPVQQYNPYVANYQAIMMAQQQAQAASLNHMANLQPRNQQNTHGYQLVAINQQQERSQGYEPLISKEDNESKYPQL